MTLMTQVLEQQQPTEIDLCFDSVRSIHDLRIDGQLIHGSYDKL